MTAPLAGIPGHHQRHNLELRTAADPQGHPSDREPACRERGQVAVEYDGERAFLSFATGAANFDRELVDGMNASLANIKAAAENS